MDGYNILLFHRADLLDCFNDANYDLILSGHLHGGQINIPFIGGLISPDMALCLIHIFCSNVERLSPFNANSPHFIKIISCIIALHLYFTNHIKKILYHSAAITRNII